MRLPTLLPLLAACGRSEPGAPAAVPDTDPTPPRHAVVIVIDTLRADVFEEVDTPVADALARDGARVEHAWAAGTWTVPSVFSMLSGAQVRQHGWNLPAARIGRYPKLPDLPSLATVLREAGFATAGFYSNPYLALELGFERGFDLWRRTVDAQMPRQFSAHVAAEWDDGKRHFAYLHLIGTHSPLRPSEAARAKWEVDPEWIDPKKGFGNEVAKRAHPPGAREAYARAYRAVAEDSDARVGEILAALGPRRADTLVVLTSDHGEMLGDHDVVGHGTWVWQGLVRVPLVVDDPHDPPGSERLPETLGIASIPAIVTEALGVDHDWPVAASAALPLVSERESWVAFSPDGRRKGVWAPDGRLDVYDLLTDPREHAAQADDGALARELAEWRSQVPAGEPALETTTVPKETAAELEALGYTAGKGGRQAPL